VFTVVRSRFLALRPRVRAVAYMMTMVLLFAMLETIAKYLSQFYPVPMIAWGRYSVHLLLMLVLFAPRMGRSLLRTTQPGAQILRASLLMGSTLFAFTALSYLPMAEVKAINFVSPLLVTIFAAWLLAETVSRARWIAVAVGFVGVLFIVRPGSGVLQWQAALPLGSALFYSLYQIMTRKFSDRERPLTTLFYSALVGCVGMTLALPMFWQLPALHHVPLFVLLGTGAGLGHFMLIKAMELENASFLSPLVYTQLIWVMLAGYIVFGDLPDSRALIGMAIIVASGLYVALGHRFRTREFPETPID